MGEVVLSAPAVSISRAKRNAEPGSRVPEIRRHLGSDCRSDRDRDVRLAVAALLASG
jgi:hypothetical protein